MPQRLISYIQLGSLLFVLLSYTASAADKTMTATANDASLIKKINADVANLDGRIKNGEFQNLKVEYSFINSEGVPPSFQYYFEQKQDEFIIRACFIHVGHETWSKDFYYYFDADGKPIKYLEKITGREDKPGPVAILYGTQNKIIWKNTGEPRMSPRQISDLFGTITAKLNSFTSY